MKIGIIFGGKSFEHDISIITASIVYHKLCNYQEIYPIYLTKDGNIVFPPSIKMELFTEPHKFKRGGFCRGGIQKGMKKIKLAAIINCMHGLNGEDGLAATLANVYEIPFVGCPADSASLLMDKYYAFCVMRINKIKTLSSAYIDEGAPILEVKYPQIVKPARLGSSIGIGVAHNEDELKVKVKEALVFDKRVVLQKYLSDYREFNQALYGCGAKLHLSKVEEVFKSTDILSFEDKYTESKVKKNKTFVENENIVHKISDISTKLYRLFQLSGIVRIDYLMSGNEIYVNEINTTPGSLAYYLFEEDLVEILTLEIKEAIRKHENALATSFNSSILLHGDFIKK